MGGDLGPRASFQAVGKLLVSHPQLHILLCIDDEHQALAVESLGDFLARIKIQICPQVISMDEKPSAALRHKRQSTMAHALMAVRDGEADGCFSCGNTGALMALARYLLPTCLGIERPALATDIPMSGHHTLMLDLGANIDASTEQLISFALMGVAWRKAQGQLEPKVALLNIGKEANKGGEEIRLASQFLQQSELINYLGFLEGSDLYRGLTDVMVCDGATGNIALKTSEGLLEFVKQQLQARFSKSILGKSLWKMISPYLKALQAELDPVTHSGAMLLGLQGLVVKGHGNSNDEAMYQAMCYTLDQLNNKTLAGFIEELEALQELAES